MPLSSASSRSFRSAYCASRQCPPERFDQAVFWAAIPARKKVLIWSLRIIRPSLFALDFELAEAVGKVTTMQQFEHEVSLHLGGIRERNWLRDRVKLRMSVHRLRKLALAHLPRN